VSAGRGLARAATGLVLMALVLPRAASGADEIGPGAYCPLPEKGEKPQCLAPAQQQYGGFFDALERSPGPETDAQLLEVESEVERGAASEHAYLALTSLSYGYYRLAQQAAAQPGQDPAVLARLERWNAVLARAYAASPRDARYRSALRQAATDIDRHVDVKLTCVDDQSEPVACDSTEHVLRGFNAESERSGIRGALQRLLERFSGGGHS
jgi:hypothetical protein